MNCVSVYVTVYVYVNLRVYLHTEEACYQDAKRKKEKKKTLKRFMQFNLRNKPSTNEKQTANFPRPQLNETRKQN